MRTPPTDRDYKRHAAQQWTEVACGTPTGGTADPETPAYFAEVDRVRYEQYAPWLRPAIDFARFRGADVLEIGFGQGTDLMQFAKAGARSVQGFDLSPTHLRRASRRFELAGVPVTLRLHDAEQTWPLDSASLDVVYSFGVLHHTPTPELAIREAYRCLRPGGTVLIGLYHSRSLFTAYQFLVWLKRGYWRIEPFDDSFWRIEQPAQGTTARPLVNRYSRRETRALVEQAGFRVRRIFVDHLGLPSFLEAAIRRVPPLAGWLAHRFGWYVVVEAVKP